MYRALSLGRAYEKELGERYPAVAEKRRAHPFYPMTFPGMAIWGHPTEEAELHDVSLQRKRKAVYCYFVGAGVIVTLPSAAALVLGYSIG
jgi:hypothetical protein